jgi:hypothetical protein
MARYERDHGQDSWHGRIRLPFPEQDVQNFSSALRPGERTAGQDYPDRPNRDRGKNLERGPEHELRASRLGMVRDIGVFRSLSLDDLIRYRYDGNATAARHDLESLLRNGLIQCRTSYPERTRYVSLTRHGHGLLAGCDLERGTAQRFYHGFVKCREAKHDAALYRLYHQEVHRIEQAGGRVKRVILDFELRRSINRRLATITSLPKFERERERQEIADSHGLEVVSGKILLPDLRLEYEGPDHEMAKVDLELVTQHYRHDNLAAKAKAGFAMYASAQDAVRARAAMTDPEIF